MPDLLPLASPLHLVLVTPLIPPNVGNVMRTCAVTGATLHLVGPIRFSLDDRKLRRAGLDYCPDVQPAVYRDWPDFEARVSAGLDPGRPLSGRLHLFTARAERSVFEATFAAGDYLVFGQEQLGLPPALLDAWPERQVGIPMLPGRRSLNLAVAVGIGAYAALGQLARGHGGTRTQGDVGEYLDSPIER
jgi:tRNA (cytidine/uridine-2'-O-)-methyltransferase